MQVFHTSLGASKHREGVASCGMQKLAQLVRSSEIRHRPALLCFPGTLALSVSIPACGDRLCVLVPRHGPEWTERWYFLRVCTEVQPLSQSTEPAPEIGLSERHLEVWLAFLAHLLVPVIGLSERPLEVWLLEGVDADDDPGSREAREQEPPDGHDGRAPERRDEAEVEGVPHLRAERLISVARASPNRGFGSQLLRHASRWH